MNRIFNATAAAVAVSAALLGNDAHAKTYTIGNDVSESVMHNKEDIYARNVAGQVRRLLSGLEIGDRVVVRSFGDYGANRSWRLDVTADKRQRPRKVVEAVTQLISSIPAIVRQGRLKIGGSTNIIAFIDDSGTSLDCGAGSQLILISDGIEASEYVNPKDLVEGRATPPANVAGDVRGCDVTIIGLGDTKKDARHSYTNAVKAFWKKFFSDRGASFQGLPYP